ncbi:Dolichyl-diphosphooligosaccharide--protein glycosyltransferase subunit WBP1 [Mycotypha africana]|uniref:Dolichyl-diphosphooligosaccharide--protein glycosyltransferase subunit WBP1 n=1 Tax=Mycotypha africana TaxID=64632 RepID=UPI002301E0AB|nr:Dolichyl-diphosphooligosaccharide--protein glycosyltransferase subunit WBP1 [Mycotypha africana]KAI8972063.1 Dolichyl-diphosphooligosaccharide--protein glycosyltransferase subunit WBP1 [Mycotypha africana]
MRGIQTLAGLLISGLTLLFFTNVEAKSATGDRVLVLLDSLSDKDTYARFWQQLEVFKSADDPSTSLQYFGQTLYHHIIHFAPKSPRLTQHPGLNNVQLVDFVNKGGNVLVATGIDANDNIRALASEFDIDLDTETVYSHNHYDSDHDRIVTTKFIAPETIIDSQKVKAPVLYTGTALSVGRLPLSTAILAAESDAFISDNYNMRARATDDVTLVGAMQTRNSARVAFVGSLDLFSDKYFDASVKEFDCLSFYSYHESGNKDFVEQLTKWVFQEKSVLKVENQSHHRQNDTEQRDWYRIKDDIIYDVDIVEYRDDHWVPYTANDVQLELIMLDPYIRTTLKQVDVKEVGRFEANIRLPDVYGVFTLKVNYKRPGLTYILAEDQISIRPFRHNEYPRYLTAAYPYYAGTGSMMVGFIIFSAIWLATWGARIDKSKSKKAEHKAKVN